MMSALRRVLSESYRAFFLAASLFAVFAGLVWCAWIAAPIMGLSLEFPQFSMLPWEWHAHEMIFGYGSAALAGFLLTAVPNWTNGPAARQTYITTVVALWCAGRIGVWFSADIPGWSVAILDLAVLPVLAMNILVQLLRRPKPQNLMFLLFIAMYWLSNLMVHLHWLGVTQDTLGRGMRGGIVTLCALVSVLGGRVTPAFTRNAMKRANIPEAGWPNSIAILEKPSLILAVLLPLTILVQVPSQYISGGAIAFSVLQVARLARWRTGWALGQPLLAALHLGVFMLALGMFLWGIAGLGFGSEAGALHVLGIGCVGGMTMAVMTRASLGHSGAALVAPRPMVWAFALVAVAAVLRWLGNIVPADWYAVAMLGAGVLWVAAFGCFVISMWPALVGPRKARSQ